MKIKNLSTGEVVKFDVLRNIDGKVATYSDYAEPSQKWCEKFAYCLIRTEETISDPKTGKSCRVFTLAEGWAVDSTRKPRASKKSEPAEAVEKVESEPAEAADFVEAEEVTSTEKPVVPSVTTALRAELSAKYGKIGEDIFDAALQIVAENGKSATPSKIIEVKNSLGEKHEVEGIFCEEFEDMLQDVEDGFYPYLWGAAGCGKTHTAEQIAKALGLDFYFSTTVQYAHDVQGYGDAGGNFVPTPFYKAFSGGGLYLQDEYDRSRSEAAIKLNTALAQGWFDFPVIGRVNAHPRFRFIAAGNTQMTGPDELYVSGETIDASSRDRVVFYEMHYDRRIELDVIAGGDEALVNFVEDVRAAIDETRISHVVSYRETKYMHARSDKKEKALIRSTFKGLATDEIRIIYGALKDKSNPWAKAMENII